MSKKKPKSPAEIADQAMQYIAIGIFLVALAKASSALIFFAGEDMVSLLRYAKTGLGILAVIVVFPQFVRLVRLKMNIPSGCAEPEGFIIDVYKRAAERAFAFTFVFLVFLDYMTGNSWSHLPTEFVADLILAASLAFFSLSFFVFNRAGDTDEGEDDFDQVQGQ